MEARHARPDGRILVWLCLMGLLLCLPLRAPAVRSVLALDRAMARHGEPFELPAVLVWAAAGYVVFAGLVSSLATRLVARASNARGRLERLATGERGAILFYEFCMLLLPLLFCLTGLFQIGDIMVGQSLVQLSAFAAGRSAQVALPETQLEGEDEVVGAYKLTDSRLDGWIKRAATVALAPMAPRSEDETLPRWPSVKNPEKKTAWQPATLFLKWPGLEDTGWMFPGFTGSQLEFAEKQTEVTVLQWTGSDFQKVTPEVDLDRTKAYAVEVTTKLYLRWPFINAVFGEKQVTDKKAWRSLELKARAPFALESNAASPERDMAGKAVRMMMWKNVLDDLFSKRPKP